MKDLIKRRRSATRFEFELDVRGELSVRSDKDAGDDSFYVLVTEFSYRFESFHSIQFSIRKVFMDEDGNDHFIILGSNEHTLYGLKGLNDGEFPSGFDSDSVSQDIDEALRQVADGDPRPGSELAESLFWKIEVAPAYESGESWIKEAVPNWFRQAMAAEGMARKITVRETMTT